MNRSIFWLKICNNIFGYNFFDQIYRLRLGHYDVTHPPCTFAEITWLVLLLCPSSSSSSVLGYPGSLSFSLDAVRSDINMRNLSLLLGAVLLVQGESLTFIWIRHFRFPKAAMILCVKFCSVSYHFYRLLAYLSTNKRYDKSHCDRMAAPSVILRVPTDCNVFTVLRKNRKHKNSVAACKL